MIGEGSEGCGVHERNYGGRGFGREREKCHADEPLAVPLDGLHFDDKLQFVEEPIEITDREVKRLKRSRIPLVKVRWNSKRGPEFTWEREDQFRKKYPHLFSKCLVISYTIAGKVAAPRIATHPELFRTTHACETVGLLPLLLPQGGGGEGWCCAYYEGREDHPCV
ncbi:hypothetical protein Tco_0904279 [Tanacetum coccineum]